MSNSAETGRDKTGHGGTRPARGWLIAALPLVIFLVLAGLFYKQLASGGASRDIPSVLIGKPAPETALEPLAGLMADGKQVPGLSAETLKGKISLVNVWSSWCGPCREEHPLLVGLGMDGRLKIVGLNYKDKPENALRFLGQLGNPYAAVGVDPRGRAAIDWGVYGVPETFLVGKDGTILHKHVGPLTPQAVEQSILPLLAGGS